jgi:DNA-binding SARP family transcriptional activator
MPSNEDMDKMILLAAEAKNEDAWGDFSRFCACRGQGARAAAFEKLDRFLDATGSWPFDKRLTFARWLLKRSRRFHDLRIVIPHPLRDRLIVSTLRE